MKIFSYLFLWFISNKLINLCGKITIKLPEKLNTNDKILYSITRDKGYRYDKEIHINSSYYIILENNTNIITNRKYIAILTSLNLKYNCFRAILIDVNTGFKFKTEEFSLTLLTPVQLNGIIQYLLLNT